MDQERTNLNDIVTAESKRHAGDEYWIKRAYGLAEQAQDAGEIPVGAVVVFNNECIGEGWNRPVASSDPTAHAEIIALRAAAQHQGNYRLPRAELYVTLEPCVMCAGAIIYARISRVVFATPDPKTGAAGSVFDILGTDALNHQVEVKAGVMQTECASLLQNFFKSRRLSE